MTQIDAAMQALTPVVKHLGSSCRCPVNEKEQEATLNYIKYWLNQVYVEGEKSGIDRAKKAVSEVAKEYIMDIEAEICRKGIKEKSIYPSDKGE